MSKFWQKASLWLAHEARTPYALIEVIDLWKHYIIKFKKIKYIFVIGCWRFHEKWEVGNT